MATSDPITGIIILAAGSSSRMGQPKQLLRYQQETLLLHAILAAKAVVKENVIVVLGANHELIQPSIADQQVNIIHNDNWQQGMGSSVKVGVEALQAHFPQVEQVILMVCDQPFVTSELLQQLITEQARTQSPIVASAYSGTIGVPVLFNKIFFPELVELQGSEGAKKLLLKYQDQVATITFDKGAIDIDTPTNHERLQQGNIPPLHQP